MTRPVIEAESTVSVADALLFTRPLISLIHIYVAGDCLSSGRLQQSTGTELAAALSASLREKLADRVENCIPELPLHSDPNSTDTVNTEFLNIVAFKQSSFIYFAVEKKMHFGLEILFRTMLIEFSRENVTRIL